MKIAPLLVPLVLCAPAPAQECLVTGYCQCPLCCGPGAHGVTASGKRVTVGMVAASPKIPFGTTVVIRGRKYVVEDRGGAIKGNHIDLFFSTHRQALLWGRQRLPVTFGGRK